jgi:hypothetical protein
MLSGGCPVWRRCSMRSRASALSSFMSLSNVILRGRCAVAPSGIDVELVAARHVRSLAAAKVLTLTVNSRRICAAANTGADGSPRAAPPTPLRTSAKANANAIAPDPTRFLNGLTAATCFSEQTPQACPRTVHRTTPAAYRVALPCHLCGSHTSHPRRNTPWPTKASTPTPASSSRATST